MSATAPSLPAVVRSFVDGPLGPASGSRGMVAVSGGPDSSALAVALAELAPDRGLALQLVHVQHGLRGEASVRDEAAARALAARLGLELVVVPAALPSGGNLEARAREARYRALAQAARMQEADWIATGHTRDDQVETLLLRLLRGGGRGALAGMRARRGRLIRPMLEATRADVRWFLADRKVEAAADASNADLRFTRNRVRHLLVPLLEREFTPRLGAQLGALAGRLRDEDDHLEAEAGARAAALGVAVHLPRAVAAEPPALARRIVRRWLERGRRRGVESGHVEAVLALAAGTRRGTVAVPGPGRVVAGVERLEWAAGRDAAERAFAEDLGPGGRVAAPGDEGWIIELSLPEADGGEPVERLPPERAAFDADALPRGLQVRSVRRGDRIHLRGVGTRKVQDVLVDRKVPRAVRRRLPVVATADAVVWLPGIARSSLAWIGPDTRRVVRAEAKGLEVFGLPVKSCGDSLVPDSRAHCPRRH